MKKLLLIIILVSVSFGGFSQAKCGDTLIDARDGKKYGTISIGNMCWMRDNLDVGAFITSATPQTNNSTIEKYGYADNSANCAIYGGLYTWNEMMGYSTTAGIQGICPQGWHLPTNAEWNTLQSAVGTNSVSKLIAGGTSNFDGEYSGVYNGTTLIFEGETALSLFWTSSIDPNNGYPIRKGLYNSFTEVYSGSGNVATSPNYGYCVRCVSNTLRTPQKDENNTIPRINKIYPNPAKDKIYVETNSEFAYTIYDSFGNNIQSESYTSEPINIESLTNGLYILKITSLLGETSCEKLQVFH